ncbi:MAG TPA: response regulator transcription factor [Saprospiraceae bacterium]|nr:response regulator transcription factor [Saprospiraceae bacterium]HRX29062.1 response regulator transcription factor [Saprospiraceae bacterium]
MAINIVVADGQHMFVEGLKAMIDSISFPSIKIEKTIERQEDILKSLSDDTNLLISELTFIDGDSLEKIEEIKKYFKDCKVLILTTYDDNKFVREAFQKGVDGYILKSNSFDDLLDAINEVTYGHTYLAKGLRITPANQRIRFSGTSRSESKYEDKFQLRQKLTRREKEILSLITQAKSNKEIAKELFISYQTVGVHRKNIMRKLGVRSTVNLIRYAIDHDLV